MLYELSEEDRLQEAPGPVSAREYIQLRQDVHDLLWRAHHHRQWMDLKVARILMDRIRERVEHYERQEKAEEEGEAK